MIFYIVPQESARVVTRFRQFHKVAKSGIRIKLPFIDKFEKAAMVSTFDDEKKGVQKTTESSRDFIVKHDINISLKELVADFPRQAVITKDNAQIAVDMVVFFRIIDPRKYVYGTENPISSLGYLTKTAVRNIIGTMMMDEVLIARDTINVKIQSEISNDVSPWGLEITRVELKDISISEELRNAMNNQLIAEREKREQVLRAEGEKESQILRAEAERQSALLKAQGKKEAAKLEAEAYMFEMQAQANGIKMINEAAPSDAYLQLKSYDALTKVADGQATKIIVPSDLQGAAGMAASLLAVAKN